MILLDKKITDFAVEDVDEKYFLEMVNTLNPDDKRDKLLLNLLVSTLRHEEELAAIKQRLKEITL